MSVIEIGNVIIDIGAVAIETENIIAIDMTETEIETGNLG